MINLTSTSSASSMPYLDVSVSFNGTNIHTSVFTKSTHRHGCLHYKSFHPIHIKKSIVYSQFNRYKRICSDKFTFKYQASNIFQHFLSKDYPLKLIYDEHRKVCQIDRNYLLKYSHKTDTNNISNIHDFHPTIQEYNQDIKKVWRKSINRKTPPIIAYRQPPKHRRILIHSKVSDTTTTLQGNSKCDEKRCQICNLIDIRTCLSLPASTSIVNPGSFSCNCCCC